MAPCPTPLPRCPPSRDGWDLSRDPKGWSCCTPGGHRAPPTRGCGDPQAIRVPTLGMAPLCPPPSAVGRGQQMLRDFRQHLLSPCHPSAPKTPPHASHPAVMGSGQGYPQSRAGMGPPRRGGRGGDGGGARRYLLLQKDFHKFPKPAGIVVPHGFGVAEGFQQGGRLQDLPVANGESPG